MIAANEQQTQMTLNAALHMRDDGGHQPPPVMGAIRVILDEQQEVATFSAPPGVSAELIQQATEMAQEQEQERGNFSLDTYHFPTHSIGNTPIWYFWTRRGPLPRSGTSF